MSELQVGMVQTLTIVRKIESGFVLTNGEDEVLLHISEAEEAVEENEEIDVFLYQDKKGNLVATMSIPEMDFDNYEWAEVVEVVKNLGVFVNIGIQKEILVSKDDLPLLESVWPQADDQLLVRLDTDQKERLLAKPATEQVIVEEYQEAPTSLYNQPISGRVYRTSKEGSAFVTEEGYRGFIHYTERKEEPRLGELVKGRVIEVKGDGTVNVSLRPLKQESMGADADEILDYLAQHDGVMHLHDKSSPDDIQATFNISKAAFKRALGKLMKEKKIVQQDGQTFLKVED